MGSPDASILACTTLPWRDGAGRMRVAVVVKVTFALHAGGLAEVTEPLPISGDVPLDPAHPGTLEYASDLVPLKMHADVTLAGRAHWQVAGAPRQVVGFAIARGADVLVQRRLVALADGTPAPRFVDPEAPQHPASFGPVAPTAGHRAAHLAGRHAPAPDAPPIALPSDFDLRFFQSAPPEQWTAPLRGGERILLVGLRPEAPAVVCRLPALHAFAQIDGPGAHRRAPPLAGDTLRIDAERLLATLTYRGSTEIDRAHAALAAEPGAFAVRAGLAPCEDIEACLAEPRAWSFFAPRSRPERPPSPQVDPVTLVDDSGFAAGTLPWTPDPATVQRAVLVKGTFDVPAAGGRVTPSSEQEGLHGDLFATAANGESADGAGAGAELDRASDFAPFKPEADLLLRGTAHAAPGHATALVTFTVGSHRARVVALPPRAFGKDGVPRPTGPFVPVPLRWAHAFGGPEHAPNPAGTGAAAGTPPPLLEDPDRLMRTRADRPRPAALAPISPSWEARRTLTGTFDSAWQRHRWPCFPDDFDPTYFQSAPAELRRPHLDGDEAFRADSVRPGGGAVSGELPSLRPRAFVERDGEPTAEVPLRLDTFVLDADAMRVTLVWRGLFDLGHRTARVTVLRDDLHAPRPFEEIATLLCARRAEGLAAPGVKPVPPARSYALADALRVRRPPAAALRGTSAATGLALALGVGTGVFGAAFGKPEPPPAPPPPSREEVEAMLAAGKDLRTVDLSGADLAGIDLAGRDLRGALLASANLTGARLASADLTGANLSGIRAASSCWDGADLTRADLTSAQLPSATLLHAKLERTKLADVRLDAARLDAAEGEGASFVRASLLRAHAPGAKLPKADFSKAAAAGAVLRGAVLDDAKLLDTEAPGAVFDEASLLDARFEKANLAGASFTAAAAAGAVFEQADLTAAVLRKAHLDGAVFAGATLARADLRGVLARGAVFRRADLTAARLDGADLMRATFEGADLRRATVTGANLYQAETWLASTEQADLTGAFLAGTKLAPRAK